MAYLRPLLLAASHPRPSVVKTKRFERERKGERQTDRRTDFSTLLEGKRAPALPTTPQHLCHSTRLRHSSSSVSHHTTHLLSSPLHRDPEARQSHTETQKPEIEREKESWQKNHEPSLPSINLPKFQIFDSSLKLNRALRQTEGSQNRKSDMFAAENGLKGDPRLDAISEAIRVVPHFPKPGIMFQDITTLLSDLKAFRYTVDIFVDRYRSMGVSVVAGVEARGFMFGPPIALAIGAKFVPLRKPRKLPGQVISESYDLEYGSDRLEMHVGAVQPGERAVVIDDLVATGGTLFAAIRLLERAGAKVAECGCVIGLPDAKERFRMKGVPLYVLVEPRRVEDCCYRNGDADTQTIAQNGMMIDGHGTS